MYKTLLVPVDARGRSARSLEVACRVAAAFDAHVIGLFIRPALYVPSPVYAEGGAKLLQELQEKMIRELMQEAKAQFDAGVKAAGAARTEWRTAEGDRAEVVALHARYADLVVVNQTDPEAADASHFADSVLLSVGRPMLLVPYVGEFRTIGQNVLVCWNASREAARAVTDALPLLARAAKVSVMTVDGHDPAAGHGESPGADIALYLARHGVKAEVTRTVSGDVDIGDIILSRAFDAGADLVVMGGYGHSRAREILLGGATRTVLRSMTVPVLMSH
jgi:nucleotide-binding universal stress UspA family protein